jgi:hypothetical protein
MTCRRQLRVWREDSDGIVVRAIKRRENKGSLGVIQLTRDALHQLRVQPSRVGEHGQRVATEALVRENIHETIVVGPG